MAGLGFQPTLGQIEEESNPSDFDDSLLDDYAVLSEHDLMVALDLHDDGCEDCDDVSSTFSQSTSDMTDSRFDSPVRHNSGDFTAMHNETKLKNETILEKYSLKPDIDKGSKKDSTNKANSLSTVNNGIPQSYITSENGFNHAVSSIGKTSYSVENGNNEIKACHHENELNTVTGIDFQSDLGKKIFMRAVNQKYMNVYYLLSTQQIFPLHPPNEGLSTLVTIAKVLKTKHNLYSQKSISNLDFDDFACFAGDCGLSVHAFRISKTDSLEEFRKTVKVSTSSKDSILVCYYTQGSQCNGHFCIVYGYCRDRDLLLVMDVATSPRWLPLQEMWKILSENNQQDSPTMMGTNMRTNGYLIVEKPVDTPSITVSINQKAAIKLESSVQQPTCQKLLSLKVEWDNWLSEVRKHNGSNTLKDCIKHIIGVISSEEFPDSKETMAPNEKTKLSYKQGSLVDSVTKTKTFPMIQDIVSTASAEELQKLNHFAEWMLDALFVAKKPLKDKKMLSAKSIKRKKKASIKTHVNINLFNNAVMLSTWLLFWPYKNQQMGNNIEDTNSSLLQEALKKDIDSFPNAVMVLFHEQISFVLKILQRSVP